MRFFLGVTIPEEVKTSLSQQLQEFVEEYPYFSYVPMDNYHITIQHFAEMESVEKIDEIVQENIFDIPSFPMYTEGAAMFLKNQITLYVSFARQKTLEQIAERIKTSLHMQIGKAFVPHMTFAKYKVPSKQQYLLIKKKLSHFDLEAPFIVDKLSLYESIPVGNQLRYVVHKEYPLLKEEDLRV